MVTFTSSVQLQSIFVGFLSNWTFFIRFFFLNDRVQMHKTARRSLKMCANARHGKYQLTFSMACRWTHMHGNWQKHDKKSRPAASKLTLQVWMGPYPVATREHIRDVHQWMPRSVYSHHTICFLIFLQNNYTHIGKIGIQQIPCFSHKGFLFIFQKAE